MKINKLKFEDQFVSEQYSKELRDVGVCQTASHYYWNDGKLTKDKAGIAAYTGHEILLALPEFISYEDHSLLTVRPNMELGWDIGYYLQKERSRFNAWEGYFPDACAVLLLRLIKSGLLYDKNQCDGCRAGYKNKSGIHELSTPATSMICERYKYSDEYDRWIDQKIKSSF
jgi:hypothetical protein